MSSITGFYRFPARASGPEGGTKPFPPERRRNEERRAHVRGIETMETLHKTRPIEAPEKATSPRWIPVAIALLGIASVAAEIWGVLRGLSLIMTR